MVFQDLDPANLYSSDVLRKALQQYSDNQLKITPTKNIPDAVAKLKTHPACVGVVHQVANDKFFALYWSPEQLFLYHQFLKEESWCSISIDATGSFTRSIQNCDGSKSPVFLYQAVCTFRGCILPILQMSSARQDANFIQFSLKDWLRKGGRIPDEVVTDRSLALINGIVNAFHNKSLSEYLDICMQQASSTEPIDPTEKLCLVRIDIAHLIHSVCKWPCIVKTNRAAKDFFVRSVGLLARASSISSFVRLYTMILTVALNPNMDPDDPNDECYRASKILLTKIKQEPNDLHRKDESIFAKFDEDIDVPDNQTRVPFLNNIEEKIKVKSTGIMDNVYYCPDFPPKLLDLSQHCLLWSSIMIGTYRRNGFMKEVKDLGLPSSARSETYFGILKTLVLKKKRPLRVDKIIIIHLMSISGSMKLLAAKSGFNTIKIPAQQIPQ